MTSSVVATIRYWQDVGLSPYQAMRALRVDPSPGESVTWGAVQIVAEMHERRLVRELGHDVAPARSVPVGPPPAPAEREVAHGEAGCCATCGRRWRLVEVVSEGELAPKAWGATSNPFARVSA